MDRRTQALLRDPDVPFEDKAHILERLDDTRAAYYMMVEGLEAQKEAIQESLRSGDPGPGAAPLLKELQRVDQDLVLWKSAGEVRQGSDVILVRGVATLRRKDRGGVHPTGEGWVSWVGNRTTPRGVPLGLCALVRVGPDKKRGFYASVADLEVVDPWRSVKRLLAEREALSYACPAVGDHIRDKATGRTGVVFWVSHDDPTQRRRLGYTPDDPRDDDMISNRGHVAGQRIVWAYAAEVEVPTSWDDVDSGS
jgi:hypothetical protein